MSGREQDRSLGGEAPAPKGQAPRRCTICRKPPTWPAVEFCGPGCSEEWIRQARERDGPLAPAGSLGPGDQARGRRRGRA